MSSEDPESSRTGDASQQKWLLVLVLAPLIYLLGYTSTGIAIRDLLTNLLFGPLNSLIELELLSVGLLLLVAILRPQVLLLPTSKAFLWLGRMRPGWSIALSGCIAGGGAALVALCAHWPEPLFSDEHCYLLLSDTFSEGRLTNPTHPLWQHFETQNVIHQPTYTAKFPPAQGMVLALGQLIGGHPLVGVWLSVGLAAAAVCWMLHGWLPRRWATLGGLLAAIRLSFWGWPPYFGAALETVNAGYWAHSYFGGAVAAGGGALLFGAFRRLIRAPRAGLSLVLGLGLCILAVSRPYEGALVSLPVAVGLLWWMVGKNGPSWRTSFGQVVLPLGLLLAAFGAGLVYYNQTVTGNPLQLPYQLHQKQYKKAPHFLWEPLRPIPPLRHRVLELQLMHYEVERYQEQRALSGFFKHLLQKLHSSWRFYLGPALTLPFLFIPWLRKNRWTLFAYSVCGILCLGLLVETYYFPHYSAPILPIVYFLLISALKQLGFQSGKDQKVRQALAMAVPLACLISVVPFVYFKAKESSSFDRLWGYQQARIISELSRDSQQHLVIVRYHPNHPPLQEWINNKADIEAAKIVWAHDMGEEKYKRLLEHFKDRRVWLLEPDASPPRLTAIPTGNEVSKEH